LKLRQERIDNVRIKPRIVRYGGAMFDQDEINAVMRPLQSPTGLVPGEKVCEFERRVAAYMGKAHGVMVNSDRPR
jgi:dTDP-4-amino-4,6-dideoxygalactose transaminase